MKALLYNAQLLAVNRMLSNLQSSADNEIKVTAGSQQVDDETFDMGSEAHSHTGKAHAHTRKFDVWQFSKDTQTNIINPVRTDPVGSSMIQKVLQTGIKLDEKGDSTDDQQRMLITQEDLDSALKETKPSLPHEKRLKYEKIYKEFRDSGSVTDVPNQRATLA
jgi:SpoVK/Ycf46/Vps4 family AAA+-type ATPase